MLSLMIPQCISRYVCLPSSLFTMTLMGSAIVTKATMIQDLPLEVLNLSHLSDVEMIHIKLYHLAVLYVFTYQITLRYSVYL